MHKKIRHLSVFSTLLSQTTSLSQTRFGCWPSILSGLAPPGSELGDVSPGSSGSSSEKRRSVILFRNLLRVLGGKLS